MLAAQIAMPFPQPSGKRRSKQIACSSMKSRMERSTRASWSGPTMSLVTLATWERLSMITVR